MSRALLVGLPTAIVSAGLYGVAPLVQARAARREEESSGLGLALLARLVLRPLWLIGLAVEAGSFLLEVYALSVAPVAMVAPVMALDMIVFTLLAQQVLGEKISRNGWLGVGSMVGGVALLAYAFARGAEVGSPASTDVLLAFLVLGLVFALICAFAANLAAARNRVAGAALGFGAAAGVSYAIATLATRQIGLAVNDRREGESALAELLSTPTPYVLVLFSVLALGLQQRGLQGRAAVIAFPVTSGVSAFLPVTLGLTLFGEPAPGGIRRFALVVAMVMVAAGIAALGRDRMAANRSVEDVDGLGLGVDSDAGSGADVGSELGSGPGPDRPGEVAADGVAGASRRWESWDDPEKTPDVGGRADEPPPTSRTGTVAHRGGTPRNL